MPKNYKKLTKDALLDKAANTVMLMKFLNSKGGVNLVQEYFSDSIPNYILEFAGLGDAAKWILRQLARKSPNGFMNKVLNKSRDDGEYLAPLDSFETIENNKNHIITKINCLYLKKLRKKGKQYKCNFDMKEYYCKYACIPLLKKVHKDIYLNIDIELLKNGCIQTISVDSTSLSKHKEKDDEIEKNKSK